MGKSSVNRVVDVDGEETARRVASQRGSESVVPDVRVDEVEEPSRWPR